MSTDQQQGDEQGGDLTLEQELAPDIDDVKIGRSASDYYDDGEIELDVELVESPRINTPATWQNSKRYFEEEYKINGPRTVRVFFRLYQIDKIDCINSEVTVDFAFFRRWIDPCFVNATQNGFGETFEEFEKYSWRPDLEINNDVSLKQLWDDDNIWSLKDEATGLMQIQQRFRGCISSYMRLNEFPFDRFPVYVNIGPAMYNMSQLFVMVEKVEQDKFDANTWTVATQNALPEGHLAKFKKAIDFTLEEWNITPEILTYIYEKPGRGKWNLQNVNHGFEVVRESTFYIYKIVSVEVILTIWSWVVFFLPGQGGLSDRFEVTLTLFLAAVAFLFVVNDKLPRVAYLTLLDKNVLGTFGLLFGTAIESWIVYMLYEQYDEDDDDTVYYKRTAEYLDFISKFLFPILYMWLTLFFFKASPEVRAFLNSLQECWLCRKIKKTTVYNEEMHENTKTMLSTPLQAKPAEKK